MNPGLLVLPGWDDDGKAQYDALKADLARHAWICRRADLPDASWPAAERDAVTREDNLRQVHEDYDALAGQARPGAVAVLGFSYGGYMAALLAGERPVPWLILRSPAIYMDAHWSTPKAELDKRALDIYRHHEHAARENRALRSCAQFRGDVLLIESECDQQIPRPVIDSYADAFSQARSLTRRTLRGADHQLSQAPWRTTYHAWVVQWLAHRCA